MILLSSQSYPFLGSLVLFDPITHFVQIDGNFGLDGFVLLQKHGSGAVHHPLPEKVCVFRLTKECGGNPVCEPFV